MILPDEASWSSRKRFAPDADIEAEAVLLLQQHHQHTAAAIYSDLDGLLA